MSFRIASHLEGSFHPYPKPQKKEKAGQSRQIKQKSSKLAKKERKRFSILQNEKKCYICNCTKNLTKHEAFGGCNRQKSMEWGLVYYLCIRCHEEVTNNENRKKKLEGLARSIFVMKYGADLFLKEFGRNF